MTRFAGTRPAIDFYEDLREDALVEALRSQQECLRVVDHNEAEDEFASVRPAATADKRSIDSSSDAFFTWFEV